MVDRTTVHCPQLELDLWGRQTAAVLAAAEKERAAAQWLARFERSWWTAPGDTAGGMRKGDRVLGWKCPSCGEVEASEFALGNNHGWHPDRPGWLPYGGGGCVAQQLRRSHAIYDQRRAMIRHLAGTGLDDGQIAARVGVWSAETVAGYRAEDAKAARRAARAARGEIVRVGHGSECPCVYCGRTCGCPSCAPVLAGSL